MCPTCTIAGATVLVYPIFIFLGVLSAILLIRLRGFPCYQRKAESAHITATDIYLIIFIALVAVIIGARLGYVAFHWHIYSQSPITILHIWRGGLIFHGGLAGGLIGSFAICRIKKISWVHIMDLSVAPLSAGYAVGRIGCFFHGCCAGVPTDLPWGVVFPIFGDALRHPTQLYAIAAGMLMFILLDRVYRRSRIPSVPLAVFLILHGTYRLLIEFIRIEPAVVLGLTHGQVFAAVMIICGASVFLHRRQAAARGKLKEEYALCGR